MSRIITKAATNPSALVAMENEKYEINDLCL